MNPNDIWAKACQMGLDKNLATIGKSPEYTISCILSRNVKFKKSIFVCVSDIPILYGLVDYDSREDTIVDENKLPDENDNIDNIQLDDKKYTLTELINIVITSIPFDDLLNIWKYLGITVSGYREGSKNTPKNKILEAVISEITSLERFNSKSRKNKRYKILNDLKFYQSLDGYLELKNKNKTLFYITVLFDLHKERNLDIISELFKEDKCLHQEVTKEEVKENIDITKYTDEIEKLKKQLKESENSRKVAEKNAKEQKNKLDTEIKILNSKIKTLDNNINETKKLNEKLMKDIGILESAVFEKNSTISVLQEEIAKLTNLAFKRKILLLDMKRVVCDDYSDRWISITSSSVLSNEIPNIEATDVWLVRDKYTFLKRGLVLRNILARYCHISVLEISIEQMINMNLEEVLL